MVEMPQHSVHANIVDLWITNVSSTVIATRGERLALYTYPLLGLALNGPEAFLIEMLRHRRDRHRRADRRDRRHSISTTSTPPSRSSTPATSPAKRPPTHARGRRRRVPMQCYNRREIPRDHTRLGEHRPSPHEPSFAPGDLSHTSAPSLGLHLGHPLLHRDRSSVERLSERSSLTRDVGPRKKASTPSGVRSTS